MAARGLTLFITDLRGCTSKEAEEKRVQKEMANIRSKFTSTKTLDSYNKKKYAWKLVYIYMLGYDVDFGHMEVINLLSGQSFTEKQVGYLATSVLMTNTDELMTLVVNSIRTDLMSQNEYYQSLALCSVANIGGRELTDTLAADVQRLAIAPTTPPAVRKKAVLCLLRLFRTDPEIILPREWGPRMATLLQNHSNELGVITSVLGLLLTLVARQGATYYKPCIEPTVQLLTQLVVKRSCHPDYVYHGTPTPWVCVKLLRLLQFFDVPFDTVVGKNLTTVLTHITTQAASRPPATGASKTNRNNAINAVLFEAMNLVIHRHSGGSDTSSSDGSESSASTGGNNNKERMREQDIELLGKFMGARELNIRYLALATMSKLALMCQRESLSDTSALIRKHQESILKSLKDTDVSIRRRALDLLFAICDASNAVMIVKALLDNLAHHADFDIKEEMVLKIAILAERHADDDRWYLDTIMQLLAIAGDHVTDDIWHCVVRIVTNRQDLQRYAAEAMYRALQPVHVHETAVKVAAYILGEFGYLLTEADEDDESDGGAAGGGGGGLVLPLITSEQLFETAHKHFSTASPESRRILIHAYIKMLNLYEELTPQITAVLESSRNALDIELQQRANEYSILPQLESETLQSVLESMPAFPKSHASALDRRLLESKSESTTVAPWENDDEDLFSGVAATGERLDEESSDGGDSSNDGNDSDASNEIDLLGMESMAEQPPAAPGRTVPVGTAGVSGRQGVHPSLLPAMKQWFMGLLGRPQGVLYADANVSVHVAHQYQASQGKLVLTVTNNNLNDTLTDVVVSVAETSEDARCFRFKVDPIASSISPGQSQNNVIMVECMAPFVSPPILHIAFTTAGSGEFDLQLRLPVAANSFMQPVIMQPDLFKPRWAAIDTPEKQQQAVFTVPALDSSTWAGALAQVKQSLSNLGIAVIGGVEENQYNLYGGCTFCTGTINAQTNKKSSIGCLLRVEIKPTANACRVTTRALHPDVAMATKHVVHQQLAVVLGALGNAQEVQTLL